MSAAMDFPVGSSACPDPYQPRERRLRVVREEWPPDDMAAAPVVALLRPRGPRRLQQPDVALRLTKRGQVVLGFATIGLALLSIGIARLSHPAGTAVLPVSYSAVLVQPGDTLWSIAERVAPQKDPRAEVDVLRKLNRLTSVELMPGQQLRLK